MSATPGVVVVSGASGLVGSALCAHLEALGYEVRRLVRRRAPAKSEFQWDPAGGSVDEAALRGADTVVHLAGENIAGGRWSSEQKQRILASRIESTATLQKAIERLEHRPTSFLCASAVGIYGDCGSAQLDEDTGPGSGFLAEVCVEWEKSCEPIAALGVRVANLRFGVVLSQHGGALAKMLPIFRLGGGGRIGSGEQFMSWISLDDCVRAIAHVLKSPSLSSPVNVVAPRACTNREFTRDLASVLRRPALLPVPAFAIKALFGEMGRETILASQRARPARLQASGFEFAHPTLLDALAAALQS